MSHTTTTSVSKRNVVKGFQPVRGDATRQLPVLITEPQVRFGTAAALWSRPTVFRRMLDAIRVAGAALHRGPAQRHHAPHSYLETSCMSREMGRL